MAHGKSRKLDHNLRAAGLVTSACSSPSPTGLTGYLELLSMEDQDARVPALEPFRVEQVVRTGVAEGEGGGLEGGGDKEGDG